MRDNQMGAVDWGAVVNSAASIFSDIKTTDAQREGYQSQYDLTKLQMQTQQQKAEANAKLLKYGLIGGVVIVGIIATVIIIR